MNKITHPRILALVPTFQQSTLRGMEINDYNEVIQSITELVEDLPDSANADYDESRNNLVALHYFYAGSDWWIKDWNPKYKEFFGYVCLNDDTEMAEYGYINVEELVNNGKVELDFYWTPKTFKEVIKKLKRRS